MLQKLKQSKSVIIEKCSTNFIFLGQKKFKQIQLIFFTLKNDLRYEIC